jgi:DNA polymerase-1
MPTNVLDLFVEFRNRANGLTTPAGFGLIGALTYFGLDSIGATEKDDMRDLVLRGGPWSDAERAAISEYCASDVAALERLLCNVAGNRPAASSIARSLHESRGHNGGERRADRHGRGGATARKMDRNTGPTDSRDRRRYGVFDGRTFKADRWEEYLIRHGIPWPRLPSGRLDLSDGAFRQMAKAHPLVSPIRELRSALSELRLNDLQVGDDGRNRALLSVFRARTGRNQPSNTKYIFGPSVWLRSLIKPPPGCGVAYIDYSQQEFGIGAALSEDVPMKAAYEDESGDPYLAFAKQAGAVPQDATKKTHGPTRELFKQCVLGVQYGMEYESLAAKLVAGDRGARSIAGAPRNVSEILDVVRCRG